MLRDRGKLLNVRDASASQITNNAEISNIKQIMGLQYGKVPSSPSSSHGWYTSMHLASIACTTACRLRMSVDAY